VVEHLPSKCEVLNSKPPFCLKKKEEGEEGEETGGEINTKTSTFGEWLSHLSLHISAHIFYGDTSICYLGIKGNVCTM
jgi:hypothetical protein